MKLTDKYVFFWKEEPMSNSTKCKIVYKNDGDSEPLTFISCEQFFMWLKAMCFRDFDIAQKILECESPEHAKKLGREIKNFDEEAWRKGRTYYMKLAVNLKFDQNEDLAKQLLDEKYDGKTFVYASYDDDIWGIGFNESIAEDNKDKWGSNLLGKILTETREKLKAKLEKSDSEEE